MDIEKDLKALLKEAVKRSGIGQVEEIPEIALITPKDRKFGDLSTNIAMVLEKKIGQPPIEIARRIREALEREKPHSILAKKIDKIETKEPGFINFFLSKLSLYEVVSEIREKGDNFGRSDIGQGKRVHLEFVSANPTGPLNVAHGRQAAFGDTLANILNFSGYKVGKEYYLNDEGLQIDLLGESVRAKYLQLLGINYEFPASGYRGKYIDELANILVQRYGARLTRNYENRLLFFSQYASNQILEQIKQDLKRFGVNFDSWFSQKNLNKSGKIDKVLTVLKKKGYLYQKDGAWWLAATKFGDDKDRVVIKSDSRLTYIAPDIAYHQSKFKRKFAIMINVWGPDHHGYISRIKAAVSALGYDAQRLKVLIVQLVSLAQADKVIPMSTRAGQYIALSDIIQAVGKDAARFFFLMRKRDAHLQFDLELAKSESLENPVYYIQYAHARLLNIVKFAKHSLKSRRVDFCPKANLSLLDKQEELTLLQTLSKFPSIIQSCAEALEPHRLTTYLQELAKGFHCYYEKHRVVTDDLQLSYARLMLVNAVRVVLRRALRLLAISAPEKM